MEQRFLFRVDICERASGTVLNLYHIVAADAELADWTARCIYNNHLDDNLPSDKLTVCTELVAVDRVA